MGDRPSGSEADDRRYLAAAIRLGRRHEGLTGDNPSVGCLLVRDGRIVATGVTEIGGRPHAEITALDRAGAGARGATAYVGLEPCAHHGRSGPCADALIAAGIARAVVALRDPFAAVDGRGIAKLRDAGIDVAVGMLEVEARDGMAGFLSRVERDRPHVLLKLAVSAEGWLGRRGERVAITGAEAARHTHLLRARADAILVGVGTVLADDPSLACRLPGMADRSPRRYVLDTSLRTPIGARVVRTARDVPTTILGMPSSDDRASALRRSDARVVDGTGVVPGGAALPGDAIEQSMISTDRIVSQLRSDGVGVLMVEGGGAVARTFLDAGLVDEVHLIAGRAIGDDPSTAEPIASPLRANEVPDGFAVTRRLALGDDRVTVLHRID